MPDIRSCRNKKCWYNSEGCYCNASEVEVAEDGSCDTCWYKQGDEACCRDAEESSSTY